MVFCLQVEVYILWVNNHLIMQDLATDSCEDGAVSTVAVKLYTQLSHFIYANYLILTTY